MFWNLSLSFSHKQPICYHYREKKPKRNFGRCRISLLFLRDSCRDLKSLLYLYDKLCCLGGFSLLTQKPDRPSRFNFQFSLWAMPKFALSPITNYNKLNKYWWNYKKLWGLEWVSGRWIRRPNINKYCFLAHCSVELFFLLTLSDINQLQFFLIIFKWRYFENNNLLKHSCALKRISKK